MHYSILDGENLWSFTGMKCMCRLLPMQQLKIWQQKLCAGFAAYLCCSTCACFCFLRLEKRVCQITHMLTLLLLFMRARNVHFFVFATRKVQNAVIITHKLVPIYSDFSFHTWEPQNKLHIYHFPLVSVYYKESAQQYGPWIPKILGPD